MGPNFDTCGARFKASNSSYPDYIYNGSVPNLFANAQRPKLITYQGCKDLCGSGVQYYPWANSSQTIATWVLPIVSVLVQAPYESNAFIKTIFALARWVGSPMATLSYTLWNIHMTAKCAMMVDMATKYGDTPPQNSAFGRIRDSFYILSVMNQCTSGMRLYLTLQLWYDIKNTRSLLLIGTYRFHQGQDASDRIGEATSHSAVQ